MFSSILSVAFLAVSVSGLVIPRAATVSGASPNPPADWWTAGLEPYAAYHSRYLQWDCETEHNTAFFNQCCHPLLKNEPVSIRPALCSAPHPHSSRVAAASHATSGFASASHATSGFASATHVLIAPSSASHVFSSAAPSASAAASDECTEGDDDCECDDGGDEDECDEGDDDCECVDEPVSSSAPAPSSTKSVVYLTSTVTAAPTSVIATSNVAVASPKPVTSSSSAPAPAPTSSSEAAPAPVSSSAPAPVPTSTAAPVPKPTSTAAPEPKPTTSSTPAPAPKPTSTPAPEPKPTSTSAAAPAQATQSGGIATFFTQNGVAGACGTVHSDSDMIVAIDSARWGPDNQKSDLCGKQVKIINDKTGKSVIATIADECPTCTGSNSIDLSIGTFEATGATQDEGIFPLSFVIL